MKKRFFAKKKSKFKFLKLSFLILIIYISLVVSFNLLLKKYTDENFKKYDVYSDLFSLGTNDKSFINRDLLDPSFMLKLSLGYDIDTTIKTPINEVELLKNHVNDENPKVYIYNTHDQEEYNSTLLESYNIKYSVKIGSYILSDYLSDHSIPSYVEKSSIKEYLSQNNLQYKHSYEASKHYILERIKEYPSIEYIIDVHRDAVGRQATTTIIDNKSYAKVLFVVGLDYDGYEENLKLAELVNSKLDSRLSRGISKKTGSGVNGIYNQNLSKKALLLEIGGLENNIEEVNNTLEVIANILSEIIGGK